MALSVEDIGVLFETNGREMYGREAVSQLEHALQCAQLAEEAGAEPELVCASLLHDLGHLLAAKADGSREDVDDVHQYFALPFLRGVFPDSVIEPVKLHVDAKRWLCAAERGYWDTLSAASKHSLELQGGFFVESEAKRFIELPHATNAVLLRRWDDLAKTPGKATPPLAHYLSILENCTLPEGIPKQESELAVQPLQPWTL